MVLDKYTSGLGQYAKAEESHCLAQAIFSSWSDAYGEAVELRRLGRLYGIQGRHHDAEECFALARVTSAGISDDGGEAEALGGLIAASGAQGKLVELRSYYRGACEIYTRMGQPMSELCAKNVEVLQGLFQSTV